MPTYVGLLRAVNVGGTTLRMETLRSVLTGLGLEEPRTLLQSGNIVFRSGATDAVALESRIETRLARETGIETELLLRTSTEWANVVAANPFPQEAATAPNRLLLAALKSAPDAAGWADLRAAIRGPEKVDGSGRHAYIVYPDGVGKSRLTPSLIERRLGVRSTSRNWNTVLRLLEVSREG